MVEYEYVQFNDSDSFQSTISTGVPQGSILGPLLFIIYMNDIATVTKKFHFTLYADDTSLVEPLCTFTTGTSDSTDISNSINFELNLITDWLCLNKLSLNAKKTKMMIFHHRQKNISSIQLHLIISNTKIEQVSEFDFLGLRLDECMTWNSHVQKISRKLSQVNGVLSRLKRFLPREILKMIYNALMLPHLNFGILLWGNNSKRIFKLQKWALRSITLSKYNAHTDPLFISLKLLKIQDIYTLALLKFYYKYKNDNLPNYFSGMFEPNFVSHEHNTRQSKKTVNIISKTKLAETSLRHSLPPAVQKTNDQVIQKIFTHSFGGYTNYVKLHLISLYNPMCNLRNCYVCNN